MVFTVYGHVGHLGHVTLLRNGLKQIFRCALALLKFVSKNESGLGLSIEPCQFSLFKVYQFHDSDNGNRS